jgi:hypothetical protein
VRLSGVDAQVSFKGSLTGDLFGLFVKYVLVPTFGVGLWCCWIVCRCIRLWVCVCLVFVLDILLI